jgi:hypothetical protein
MAAHQQSSYGKLDAFSLLLHIWVLSGHPAPSSDFITCQFQCFHFISQSHSSPPLALLQLRSPNLSPSLLCQVVLCPDSQMPQYSHPLDISSPSASLPIYLTLLWSLPSNFAIITLRVYHTYLHLSFGKQAALPVFAQYFRCLCLIYPTSCCLLRATGFNALYVSRLGTHSSVNAC